MNSFRRFVARCACTAPMFGFLAAITIIVLGPYLFIGADKQPAKPSAVESLKWRDPQSDGQTTIRDRTGRSVMQMSKLLLIAVSGYCFLRCSIKILLSWRSHGRYKWAIVALAIISICGCVRFVNSSANPFWVNSVPASLFAKACEITGSERLLVARSWSHFLAELAIVSLAFEVCLVIAKESKDIKMLSGQLKATRSLLYHGAIVLILLSIAAATNVLWAAAFLPSGENSEASFAQKLALGVAMDAGVYNLILLALVFSPAIWILTRRVPGVVQSVLPAGFDDDKLQKIMKTHGLATSPADYYWQAASLASPLLGAVPFTAMLTFLLE